MSFSSLRRASALAAAVLFAVPAFAAEVHVVSSGGFAAAYKELAPAFEKDTGNTLAAAWGPSMGETENAVPQRLKRAETIDVLIMVGYALDDLIKQGKVDPASKVELAKSGVYMAVKAGAPKPDISTADGLRKALLAAKSIAYSDSASGVYIEKEMFKKLGIEDQVKGKAHKIPATPVGEIVASGEAEIGFQQASELLPVKGIDIVGAIPEEVQLYTVFSAGVLATSKEPAAAKALLAFLGSKQAAPVIVKTGMEPIAGAR